MARRRRVQMSRTPLGMSCHPERILHNTSRTFPFFRGSAVLVLLRHFARLLASRAKRSFLVYDGGQTDVELKPCRYCNNWVPAETRVCTHCHAIIVR